MASNKKTLAAVERFPSRPPNALPAYQRIQSVIRKRIDSGQLQAGDPVPSERELAKTHHVSLMTARHALASLEREGFVERRRGIGTFVTPPKIHFNKLMSYTEQMAARTLTRSEEHTSELQSRLHLVCRLLLEKKKKNNTSLLQLHTLIILASSLLRSL